MRSVFLAVFLAFSGTLALQAVESRAIQWHDNVPSVEERKSKPILLYFTTSGCGYCVKMKSSTLSDREVVQRVQDEFVPIKLDARKHPAVAKNLRIRVFPSTVIIHPGGTVVEMIPGYVAPGDFLNRLSAAKQKLDYESTRVAAKEGSTPR